MRYLTNHPEATDSVAGIAEWWLMRDSIEIALSEIRGALRELLDAELVSESGGIGRPTFYHLNRDALDQAREIVGADDPAAQRTRR